MIIDKTVIPIPVYKRICLVFLLLPVFEPAATPTPSRAKGIVAQAVQNYYLFSSSLFLFILLYKIENFFI